MNARDVLASVTGYCDACGAGPGVVCDPFCLGVAAEQDEQYEQFTRECPDRPEGHMRSPGTRRGKPVGVWCVLCQEELEPKT